MAERPEWFRPTSGRVVGWAGLATAATVLVLALVEPAESGALAVAAGAAFVGVVCWVALLRPRLGVTPETLVLRGTLRTVHLPLAAVESIAVGQMLAVRVAGRRYTSPAVGKSVRRVLRDAAANPGPQDADDGAIAPRLAELPYADYVVARIQQCSDDARMSQRIVRGSPEQAALATEVRNERAVPELAALVVTGVVFLAALLF